MEVRVTKCQNGHYFDLNKHEVCPHCGAPEFTSSPVQAKNSGFALFKKKEKSEEISTEHKKSKSFSTMPDKGIKIEDVVPTDSQQAFVIEDVVTEGAFSMEQDSLVVEDVETEGFFSNSDTSAISDVPTPNNSPFIDISSVSEDEITAGFFSEEPISNTHPATNGTTLLEEIQNVTANNDVKTVGIFSLNNTTADNNATTDNHQQIDEPVVGWLVCICGKYIGTDFKIVAGKNSIGRNRTNNIAIENEESVSREKHAWIIFEPRKREFFVKPGESSGLTYLNDENIFDVQKLNKGDILEFGNSKFIFIPLCGEDFSWNDYIGKE